MKSLFSILFFFVFFVTLVSSQNGTLRGKVLDPSGLEVIGANVMVKGTATGTTTDLDGTFELSLPPSAYSIEITYLGLAATTINDVVIEAKKVTVLGDVLMQEDSKTLEEVVVTAKAIRTSEVALLAVKRNSTLMMDGISSAKMKLTGDGNAVEASKRVTGVSVEGGKYVYIRGLGDRYSKTTLNGMDIPGLDPDRNSLQMDIFPTNLIDNIQVGKNFIAENPADYSGGILNIETKDFPEQPVFDISVGANYNPSMHFNNNFVDYKGSSTDMLGFDNGDRALPSLARSANIPTPISGASSQQVNSFVNSFNNQLATQRVMSMMDMSASLSIANQLSLNKSSLNSSKLGYIFSLTYKSDTRYYDDISYGEYQKVIDPNVYNMRYATVQNGELGERNFLLGALAGLAYKTQNTKIKLSVMHLQNGERRAGQFEILNDGEAVGQSGYYATSDNLEYNQRALTNVLLAGTHNLKNDWNVEWKLSPTLSSSMDPDIRKTAFTIDQESDRISFLAGAGGNPSRIWRELSELNASARLDFTKKYKFRGQEAKLKFGGLYTHKQRDYEILFFDVQFFGQQSPWATNDASQVLTPGNIFPSNKNNIYYNSGNPNPNPNAYSSNVNSTAGYISTEMNVTTRLKTILGLRVENYVQRHTGRDQRYAGGDITNGRNFDNDIVLDDFDFFPSINFIYKAGENQNIRLSYSRTIARPSFKELSFAQILDPISNRIFNGSLFTYEAWNGNLVSSDIDNIDLRWELFQENGQLFSVSPFYKRFANPIELVRIPEQQTSTEFQPRNVGTGEVYGVELELRKNIGFISEKLENLDVNANLTYVYSEIDMTEVEFNARKSYQKTGETIKDTRAMAGQAPYVINLGMTYNHSDKNLNIGMFYNVKGPTLFIVGAGLFPDIYTQPFHSLNLSVNKRFGKDLKSAIDIRFINLLDAEFKEYYSSYKAENEIFTYFKPGRSFSLTYSFKLR